MTILFTIETLFNIGEDVFVVKEVSVPLFDDGIHIGNQYKLLISRGKVSGIVLSGVHDGKTAVSQYWQYVVDFEARHKTNPCEMLPIEQTHFSESHLSRTLDEAKLRRDNMNREKEEHRQQQCDLYKMEE